MIRKQKDKKRQQNESDQEQPLKKKKHLRKKDRTDQIIRIEELEELMAKYGDDVDPETVVSMYIPHRKRRRIGAALLHLDKLNLLLLGLLLTAVLLFIAAFMLSLIHI